MDDPWAQENKQEASASETLTFFEKIINVLFHPKDFFEWLSKNHSTKEAAKFFLLCNYLVYGILFLISVIGIIVLKSFITKLLPAILVSLGVIILIGIFLIFTIIFPLLSLLSLFVGASISHVIILIFGGRDYSKTFSVGIYSLTPAFIAALFLPIPLIGIIIIILASIWSSILGFYGIMKVHEFSFWKTLLLYLIPVCIMGLLIIAAIFFSGGLKDILPIR